MPGRARPRLDQARRLIVLTAIVVLVIELLGAPHVRISGSPNDPKYLTLSGVRYMGAEINSSIAPVTMMAPLERHSWEYAYDAAEWVWARVRSHLRAHTDNTRG